MNPSQESDAPILGLPGWVMTFADLMTLLMCFFVLMLSFSEMDVAKFKQLAGSMKDAFGVQADIEVKTIPKGTSIIAQEFSPGRPEPTVVNDVRQYTINSNMNTLDLGLDPDPAQAARLRDLERRERLAEQQAGLLKDALRSEIEEGRLLVRVESTDVIIQILERDSFASGSADLEPDFLPTLARIGELLGSLTGAIAVSGHTDNVPIATSRYRSNWDLAAARGASVAHELLEAGIDPPRLLVSGHADTQPRAPNDSAANRALNRRIDITLAASKERHGSWNDTEATNAPRSDVVVPPGSGPEAPAAR